MSKLTQRQKVLQLLKERPNEFTPAWQFVGEKYTKRYGWIFMSYKAPARLSQLYKEGLVERKKVKGKTGSKYFAYKLVKRESEYRFK